MTWSHSPYTSKVIHCDPKELGPALKDPFSINLIPYLN